MLHKQNEYQTHIRVSRTYRVYEQFEVNIEKIRKKLSKKFARNFTQTDLVQFAAYYASKALAEELTEEYKNF